MIAGNVIKRTGMILVAVVVLAAATCTQAMAKPEYLAVKGAKEIKVVAEPGGETAADYVYNGMCIKTTGETKKVAGSGTWVQMQYPHSGWIPADNINRSRKAVECKYAYDLLAQMYESIKNQEKAAAQPAIDCTAQEYMFSATPDFEKWLKGRIAPSFKYVTIRRALDEPETSEVKMAPDQAAATIAQDSGFTGSLQNDCKTVTPASFHQKFIIYSRGKKSELLLIPYGDVMDISFSWTFTLIRGRYKLTEVELALEE